VTQITSNLSIALPLKACPLWAPELSRRVAIGLLKRALGLDSPPNAPAMGRWVVYDFETALAFTRIAG
jgi:hypothetical protein